MVAKEYLTLFKVACTFRDHYDVKCEEPAVAVYVSDDDLHIGRYVCLKHAEESSEHADGPVFWQKEGS